MAETNDRLPETQKINAPLMLAQARNPHLTATPEFQFKLWKFCPWCGLIREVFVRDMRMKMSEADSKGLLATTTEDSK